MKKKTYKKIAGFGIAVILLAIVVMLLMKSRNDMQEELSSMKNYNEIIPVETATARVIDFSSEITESGLFFSNSDVTVVSETIGKIEQLNVQVGSKVRAGQVLAVVESKVIRSQFDLAKENLEKAETDLARFKSLIGGEATTQQQLDVAELAWQQAQTNYAEAKKHLENKTLKAPVSGIISERYVEKGTWLADGMKVCVISCQNRMKFQVKLAGNDLKGISAGQTVKLKTETLPGKIFTGKVKNTGVVADLSGRYPVEVDVPNPGNLLRSGMIGSAVFNLPAEKDKLVIPRKCIDGSLQQAHVFVVKGDSVVSRQVTAELLDNESASILSGLQPGEQVVTTGQINLTDGTKVKVIDN